MAVDASEAFRRIPSVDEILRWEATRALLVSYPRWAVIRAVRELLEEVRGHARQQQSTPADVESAVRMEVLAPRIARLARTSLRRVINATGVVLHTNLGRAPLSDRALAAVQEIGGGYSTLEYDPERRERASRQA